ncbi:MAG: PEP-utilizing enzyme [Candidatus Micrarchaeota archaeon]
MNRKKMSLVSFEEISGCSNVFPWAYAWKGWIVGQKRYIPRTFSIGRLLSVNGDLKFVQEEKEGIEVSKGVIEKARKREFVELIRRDTAVTMRDTAQFIKNELEQDLSKKTNAELSEIYMKANELITELYAASAVPSVMDMYHTLFSEMLLNYVKKRCVEVGISEDKAGEVFAALTTVERKTLPQLQEEEFFKLLSEIQNSEKWQVLLNMGKWKEDKTLASKINTLSEKYGWLSRGYEGKVTWTPEYFANLLASELKNKGDALEELRGLEKMRRDLLENQKKYEAKLAMNAEYKQFFYAAREFTIIKSDRKFETLKLYWKLDPLIQEIAKRFQITEKQCRYILPDEMSSVLKSGKVDVNLLNERRKLSCLIVTEKEIKTLTGEEAKKIYDIVNITKLDKNEVTGHCACPGKAKGIARIVNTTQDMAKMQQGDILVAHSTNPELVPAMKLASAIVAEEGGITSHAAIVSRELGVPCVIGTKIATKVFQDGDLIEVDANKGIARKVKS